MILTEDEKSYVGPMMRLTQFRLKVRLPSTRSLKALEDGVSLPSTGSLSQYDHQHHVIQCSNLLIAGKERV